MDMATTSFNEIQEVKSEGICGGGGTPSVPTSHILVYRREIIVVILRACGPTRDQVKISLSVPKFCTCF